MFASGLNFQSKLSSYQEATRFKGMKPPTLHGEIHVKKPGFPKQVRYQWIHHQTQLECKFVSFSLLDFTGEAANKYVKWRKHLIFIYISFDDPAENLKYPISNAVLIYTVIRLF